MCLYIYLFAFILKLRMLSSITIYLSIYLSTYLSIYLSSYMHITPSLIKSNIKPPIGTRATKAPHGRTHSSQQGQMLQQLQRPGEKKTVVFSRKNGDVHYIIMTFHHQNISKHIKTHIKTGIWHQHLGFKWFSHQNISKTCGDSTWFNQQKPP